MSRHLVHELLLEWGVEHGFGLRGAPEPAALRRPRQVHGARVVTAEACAADPPPEADAVVAREPGVAIGVVTADCVPILAAARGGRAVAAVHAGWRGLGRGAVEAGVAALARAAGVPPAQLRAVVGPYIGPCCYEVDAPVLDAMASRFGDALAPALRPSRPGHARIDLGALARAALRAAGLPPDALASVPEACTACDPERFHSYRRDGEGAGRLVHFVRVPPMEA